jgi:hypothetical protein
VIAHILQTYTLDNMRCLPAVTYSERPPNIHRTTFARTTTSSGSASELARLPEEVLPSTLILSLHLIIPRHNSSIAGRRWALRAASFAVRRARGLRRRSRARASRVVAVVAGGAVAHALLLGGLAALGASMAIAVHEDVDALAALVVRLMAVLVVCFRELGDYIPRVEEPGNLWR